MRTPRIALWMHMAAVCLVSYLLLVGLEWLVGAVELRVWGTREFVTSASGLSLPLCAFVAALVGGAVATSLGLGVRAGWSAVLAGIVAFFVTATIGGYHPFMAAIRQTYSSFLPSADISIVVYSTLGLWSLSGLMIGAPPQRMCARGPSMGVVRVAVSLALGIVLLQSLYLPMAYVELRQHEFTHRSIHNLTQQLSTGRKSQP